MATYKISDLYNILSELANDGYEYVNIDLIEAVGEEPESLSLDAIEDSFSTVNDSVECCTIPEDYSIHNKLTRSIRPTDYCCEMNFTYEELGTIHHAATNALEYFSDLLKDPSQPKDIVKEIKQSSVELRNLQAKLAHFLKCLH